MSKTLSIFVRTEMKILDFVENMNSILNVKFNELIVEDINIYRFTGLFIEIDIDKENTYEDDMGIPFSEYNYIINIYTDIKVNESEYWENHQYYLSMMIYKYLTEKKNFQCMIVDEFQKIIERNNQISSMTL